MIQKRMNHLMYVFLVCIHGITLAYDDLSYKKVATQSGTFPGPHYDANNAVDGNITTCMRANEIGMHAPDKTVWWKVDLGGHRNIYSISILFKNYIGYESRQQGRFAGFSLYVSQTDVLSRSDIQGSILCYKDGPQLPPLNFTTACIEYGRYIIYYNERLNGVSYPKEYEIYTVFTELCEISVEGCIKHGVYGNQCNIPCPMNCKDRICNMQNGTCYECEPGWTGTFCAIKCAVGRYGVDCRGICSGHCGDSNTCNLVTGGCDGACASGWTGYLCDKECEDGIYGYNCVNNCSGHCLNNSPCNKQTGHCDSGCHPGDTNVFCSKICRPEYYGNGCENLCNGYCMNNEVCNNIDGVCSAGCQDGYIGKYCNTSCKVSFFGRDCSSVCSPYCKTCRNTDGHCSCFAGYTGYKCTTACFQSYGENCRYPCSEHCYNKNCDRFNGSCLVGCTDEFYGERCEKGMTLCTCLLITHLIGITGGYVDLSYKKNAIQSSTRNGPYDAENAVDRNNTTCMRTYPIGQNSPEKATWWKVDLGGLYSIYSVNIQFKIYEGYGCSHGVYGVQCDVSCPINCKDSICHIQHGTCFACKPGWTGTFCTIECTKGWYGNNCSQQCVGHCRDGYTCNHVTGECKRGCDAGWIGFACEKECIEGTFGNGCTNNCSGHCLNDSTCNKRTGYCDEGCSPGYIDAFCSENCISGYFGNGCANQCSGHCLNNEVCNHINGTCIAGCQDGYFGSNCNKSCKKGFFGGNCSFVCSPHCKTCRHTDGYCGCFDGYTGYNCNTACFKSYGENCRHPCSEHCYNKNCERFNGSCLTGCTDGFYGERCEQNIHTLRQELSCSINWIAGFSVSLAFNFILVACTCVFCRGSYTQILLTARNLLTCCKNFAPEYYTDTDIKHEETSPYQELDVYASGAELAYQNTALR